MTEIPQFDDYQALKEELSQGAPWHQFIACKDINPLVFERKAANEPWKDFEKRIAIARVACGRCLVKDVCLDDALEHKDFELFRGGMSGDDIETISRRRQRYAS
ncbi:MAG TPA: WhiB family transcriptional regulator [Candidatus Saccharimonadales bacterium]|nr:WhiB family transcriptional regulator [Candidatus Saccharimonadales bacterium]